MLHDTESEFVFQSNDEIIQWVMENNWTSISSVSFGVEMSGYLSEIGLISYRDDMHLIFNY